jgi:hypothetical protein
MPIFPQDSNASRFTVKNFDEWREWLKELAIRYYPDTVNDYTQASANSLFMAHLAKIAEQLGFYIDFSTNETFSETVIQFDNALKLARGKGFKPQFGYSAHGTVALYITVPISDTGLEPDLRYAPVLRKGTILAGIDGGTFLLAEDVDFSTGSEVRVGSVSSVTGTPLTYILKSYGKVISGEVKTVELTAGDYQEFVKFTISDSNISEIIKVTDSEGHEYFEVGGLAQNTIYQEVGYDTTASVMVLKPVVVARRFTTCHYPDRTVLQFGGGSDSLATEYVNEPQDVILEFTGRNYISDFSFDPMHLVKNDKFGIAPANTTLTVTYRANASSNVNLGVGQLTNVVDGQFTFLNALTLDSNTINNTRNSLLVYNEEPISGALELNNTLELKARIWGAGATQERAVAAIDYRPMVYKMPARFGGIYRCNAVPKVNRTLRTDMLIFVTGQDVDGTLVDLNDVVKENLKGWLTTFQMYGGSYKILDAKIVNLGLDYEVLLEQSYNRTKAIEDCNRALRDLYSTKNEVGESFSITDIYKTLENVPGVIQVPNMRIYQKFGGAYSTTAFDLNSAISPDGRFITAPANTIFEVRYPDVDIAGDAQ